MYARRILVPTVGITRPPGGLRACIAPFLAGTVPVREFVVEGEKVVKLEFGRKVLGIAALALGLGLLGNLAALAAKPPETTEDGLKLVKVKGIDVAYVRPGATLAPFKRVMMDPAQVAFSKDWDPERTGSRMKLTSEEREKIRTELAQLFDKTFKEELEKGGYPVVTEAAPDVLLVTAALIDVYANAPDTMEPGRSRTYVMNAGHATLIAELRDSETKAILARVADLQEARDDGFLQISNSVANSAEARAMVQRWARILVKRLDTVHKQPASK
jgi:Protein of unknown function (DUF3313)